MELIALIASSVYFVVLLVLGLVALTILVGVYSGVEGRFRLFLLGVSLLVVFLATFTILLYSPDWLAIAFMLLGAVLPWVSMWQYVANTRRSGELLMALPRKREKWSSSMRGGIVFVLFGLLIFIFNNPLTSQKTYALGILCISWGAFGIAQRTRSSQIREKGILYEFGGLYNWDNIESYIWRSGEDKLSVKLKKSLLRHHVNMILPSQHRQDAMPILAKKIDRAETNEQKYAPNSNAG